MINQLRAMIPADGFDSYLELCAGSAAICREIIPASQPRTIVEADVGQAKLLEYMRDHPVELATEVLMQGYSREVFDAALELKKTGYKGNDKGIAVARLQMLEMSFNSSCESFRDIDKGALDDFRLAISAEKYRERFNRRLLADSQKVSDQLQGVEIINDDMMNYLTRLNDNRLFCSIDPPYRPTLRSAGKRGYDTDWEETDHSRFLQELIKLSRAGKLNAKVLIFGYVEPDLTKDLYCNALLPEGFTLYFLKDVCLPGIFSAKRVYRKKHRQWECVFVNYEPIESGIVARNRMVAFEDWCQLRKEVG